MKITNSSRLSILLAILVTTLPISRSEAKRHGDDSGVDVKKALELMDGKHFDQAAEEFSKVIAAHPQDPRLYHNRAVAYFDAAQAADAARDAAGAATRITAAIADFSKEIELTPKDEAGYLGRGQAEVLQKQYDTAIADLNKALELKPDNPVAIKFRGFADIGLYQWDKAVVDFTTVIQKDPNDSVSYDRRAWAYRNLKNTDAAIADYTTMLQKNPNDADTLAKRGYTYSLAQQYDKAIADYEQALKINPNDTETPQRLQYARGMLVAKNVPPPVATPTPEAGPGLLTPTNIVIGVVALIAILVVVRLLTRGKPEPTSSRIR